MLFSFRNRRDKSADEARRSAFKERVSRIAGLTDADAVTVSEIACRDPGCADVETIILLMRRGEPTQAVKLGTPVDEVTDDAIEAALAVLSRRRG
ncbi:hypothetical protein [Enterovirga aerilata]|uniref:Nitrate reductase n=1 Tax=Enterovirga aerilata TaxID=2730920 RepID=A0A849IE68_9HYPH|nr:hypothetical protein [Enterovirga sp. DB1703]NNM74267.1 hypothetical protein [Enterovirga sp. DB1703]